MSEPDRYSAVSTINHWLTALLVVSMLVLGFAAAAAPEEAIEDYVLGIHVGLGFFVFVFMVWRVGYRIYGGFPPNIGTTAAERWLAYSVHRALLIFLSLQVLTGPLYLFTEGECMNVFGWFSVCIPLEGLSALHEAFEWLHVAVGVYLLPALILLHLLGAIRHYATRAGREAPSDM